MNGERVLDQVIRTQTATARPGFDLERVVRGVLDGARTLIGAESAAVMLSGRGRIASEEPDAENAVALEVPLPPTAPTAGALTVYARHERRFTAEDRQVLELLAGLIGSTLTRAALDEGSARASLRR